MLCRLRSAARLMVAALFSVGLFWSVAAARLQSQPAETPPVPPPWGTYRGNPQRTGNTDNQPGPRQPVIRWVLKSQDHFVAAPVPLGDAIYVAGIGAFNRPAIAVLPLQGGPQPPPPRWSKSAPYLKLPSVSSPALAGDYLLFGDGMHQDAGGVFHCLEARTGLPLWQLPLPGDLIHLEGAPLVLGRRAYIGAGNAGVLAVQWDTALLDGREHDLPTVRQRQQQRWKELQERYEQDKKKDPDFALPPDDSQLLKFAPKKLWQKGENHWHVDAPLNCSGPLLLVPSAYLDKEKVGSRGLYALKADSGELVWQAKLTYNPWGGATVAGDLILVPGSSIGYYYKELRQARGELTALEAKTGQVRWRKEIASGGLLACVAVADSLAVTTATDGKVRAFRLNDGERAWLYDAKAPFFAPPAIAAGTVYVADLNAVVHALDLKTGQPLWTLPLAQQIGNPGMVYGGITVHNGLLILATCNLDGPFLGKPTAVVCIGNR
ncbi:MAG: PQQ-like beta-propeller repeat protein [Gemmataceae bacterium]|nr:PQQ-like beta-propeller repeat protein [Gemmataceae bacterium]